MLRAVLLGNIEFTPYRGFKKTFLTKTEPLTLGFCMVLRDLSPRRWEVGGGGGKLGFCPFPSLSATIYSPCRLAGDHGATESKSTSQV